MRRFCKPSSPGFPGDPVEAGTTLPKSVWKAGTSPAMADYGLRRVLLRAPAKAGATSAMKRAISSLT